jgi:beta-glucanase (GH16 family)
MDVLEGLGGRACQFFHDPSGEPGDCSSADYTGWHTFAADWQPGSVTYYYDGKAVQTISSGITSSPMFLLLTNTVAGGHAVPGVMKVDYVRVWSGS